MNNTTETPVQYGAGYLDAEQLAAQNARLAAAPLAIYGKDYRHEPEVDASVAAVDVAPIGDGVKAPAGTEGGEGGEGGEVEPDQFTVKQLGQMLSPDTLKTTPENFETAFHAEAFRKEPVRKTALVLLLEAAKILGKTEHAVELQATLDEKFPAQ